MVYRDGVTCHTRRVTYWDRTYESSFTGQDVSFSESRSKIVFPRNGDEGLGRSAEDLDRVEARSVCLIIRYSGRAQTWVPETGG